ncbi:hypothetical protein CAPTEDRAFT_174884 [Capitella teleta]|uniref:Uncharacterized protein n=1 Tax=Capitella teleta TaxID=283909 RepID=R7UNM8_CAPTE|nr:hypothetical protein CAPTEDRAFT_174884 [Capitella teleta]|eukprot:ELU04996.1 hypothetical protein CAPTEDRAFT_174884 [Capitella teleta]
MADSSQLNRPRHSQAHLWKDAARRAHFNQKEGLFKDSTARRHSVDFSSSPPSSDLYLFGRRRRTVAQVENTYQLSPDDIFPVMKVERIIKEVLEEHLEKTVYNSIQMGIISRATADIIKLKVKEVTPPRFKIITWTVITEKKDNSIRTASKCLWDTQFDRSATYVFENATLYAAGMVFAVYLD